MSEAFEGVVFRSDERTARQAVLNRRRNKLMQVMGVLDLLDDVET